MKPRRVLVLCYHFPPTPSVGSVRVAGLAKYLPRFGWEPTVLTPARPGREGTGFRLVETEDRDLAATLKRRLGLRPGATLKDQLAATGSRPSPLRAWAIEQAKALTLWPDAVRGWATLAAETGSRVLEDGGFAALLTSSPPVSVHLAGRRLKELTGTPWLADLRDLWADDHNSYAPAWRRAVDRLIEKRTLGRADALVTVSEPLRERLASRYPDVETRTILNGYDPEFVRATALSPRFTLTHSGTMAEGRRDPALLLDAVSRLIAAGRIPRERLRIRFYSRQEPWLQAMVERFRLADVVEVAGWVPWRESLAAQQESQVLLLFHWGGPREVGVYTGKVFEYLAARRPILVLGGGEGVLHDLIVETGAGVHLSDREGVEHQLASWYEAFAATGVVPYAGSEDRISRYSHLRMAEEFAAVLDRFTKPRRAGA